jgi:DNA transposition AAA+ family ATPase
MSNQMGRETAGFVLTKEYRLFAEFCDACRRSRYIGLGYGPPGAGKTESARYYAQWNQVEPLLPEPLVTFTGRSVTDGFFPYKPFRFSSAPSEAPILECRTVFYTPPVSASPWRIEREIMALCASFAYLVEAANQRHQGKDEFLVTRRFSHLVELLIVDEANRLKDAGLEQIRDLYDRGRFGLILLGMPGLEKRLARAPQLYSRIGFAHQIHPLAEEETRFFLEQRWSHRIKVYSEDFTDREALAALLRLTRGNIRLIERLMMQVEHILVANQLEVVTAEVVETARENLVIGLS